MEDYLNMNEKIKYEVIKKVVEGKKSKQRAESKKTRIRAHLSIQ